ncbi:MAG: glutamate racemase [Alphaproteobacteria bacterium]|nr:MAG: glutamate racemase [Alphaproteobacteria bacterium]
MVIGVFDSGSGGLTVLEALIAAMPDRDFLYFGDHARAPYGTRSAEDVYRSTLTAVDFLLDQGCRLIVIACNTAAAVALRRLQQTWLSARAPGARVLGVHVPLVEAITGTRWRDGAAVGPMRERPRRLAVFATPRTVASRAFTTEIALRAPTIRVIEIACPGLADAIEANANDETLDRLVRGFADRLRDHPDVRDGIDAAALACTHYPFAESAFRRALPPGTDLLLQPRLVAAALADYLARNPDLDSPGTGRLRLLTSGDPARLDGLLERLPASLRQFERVALASPA